MASCKECKYYTTVQELFPEEVKNKPSFLGNPYSLIWKHIDIPSCGVMPETIKIGGRQNTPCSLFEAKDEKA